MHLTNKSIQTGYWGFAMNPFVVQLARDTGDYPDDSQFQQVVLKLMIGGDVQNPDDEEGVTVMPLKVLATDTATIDISTAFVSYLSKPSMELNLPYLYSIENVDMDEPITATVFFYKRYFKDGQEYTQLINGLRLVLHVIRGGVSEATRWLWGQQHANSVLQQHTIAGSDALRLSTKPDETEVRSNDDRVAIVEFGNRSDIVGTYTEMISAGEDDIEEYGIDIHTEDNPDRHEFVFENSFGAIETCSARLLESAGNDVDSNSVTYRGEPSFLPNNTHRTKNVIKEPEWQMSSGYLSLEQAKWWMGEFCKSPKVFMRLSDGNLLPVTISIKKTTLYDRAAAADLPHVDFTVKSGLLGTIKL